MTGEYRRFSTGDQRKPRSRAKPKIERSENIRSVPVAEIRIDSIYQRDLRAERVRHLVDKWDPKLAGVVILSSRAGSLWCVDGQHRLGAMRELAIDHVDAVVLDGLLQTEEASLFVQYNNARKTLDAWDAFKAEIAAQNPDALEVVRIVNSTGFMLTRIPGPNNIQALQAVRRVHKLGGEELLTVTLQTIRRLWASDRLALSSRIIGGLGLFYRGYLADENFKQDRLTKVLENTAPSAFLRAAQQIQYERMATGASSFAVAEAIRAKYNEGLAKVNRLSPLKTTHGRAFTLARAGELRGE